jgi:hypothetical protein
VSKNKATISCVKTPQEKSQAQNSHPYKRLNTSLKPPEANPPETETTPPLKETANPHQKTNHGKIKSK